MQIGNKVAMVGNKVNILDAPPVIRKDRTFVPIRFIAEGFGSKVDWDPINYTVLIERLSLKWVLLKDYSELISGGSISCLVFTGDHHYIFTFI